jgi:hypothetical protein
MNLRERILALATGGVVALLVGFLLFSKLVLQPAADLDGQVTDLGTKITRLKAENARIAEYRQSLREVALQTYDVEERQASERARARLVEILQRSGIALDRLSLRPVRGARVPSAYQEVGWLLTVRGHAEQIVNCLYLIQNDSYMHRLDNVSLSPVARSDEIELRLRYATLVILYPKDEKPIRRPADQPPAPLAEVNAPARQGYRLIAERDLFRPYIPRVEEAPMDSPPVIYTPGPAPTSDYRLRIVGLSSWAGQPEVVVRDTGTGQTQVLHVGDELVGGRVVLVDYRKMPMPGKPEILSTSRVIVEVDQAYWAIELGQTLAERRLLGHDQLPPQLAQAAATDEQP